MTEIRIGVVPYAPAEPPRVVTAARPPGDPLTPVVPLEGVPGRDGAAAPASQDPTLLYLSLLAGHVE